MVITLSDGINFGNQIFVLNNGTQKLDTPSLDEGKLTCLIYFNYSST